MDKRQDAAVMVQYPVRDAARCQIVDIFGAPNHFNHIDMPPVLGLCLLVLRAPLLVVLASLLPP